MERITLSDLNEICRERGIRLYSFFASDGSEKNMDRTIIIRSSYTSMEVFYSPAVLIFKKDSDVLQLVRVREIRMMDCGNAGLVFDVVCKGSGGKNKEKTYHFSAA